VGLRVNPGLTPRNEYSRWVQNDVSHKRAVEGRPLRAMEDGVYGLILVSNPLSLRSNPCNEYSRWMQNDMSYEGAVEGRPLRAMKDRGKLLVTAWQIELGVEQRRRARPAALSLPHHSLRRGQASIGARDNKGTPTIALHLRRDRQSI